MLHEFIAVNRTEIIRRCRAKVASQSMPPPTDREIDHGVPVFLDQLVTALRLGLSSSPEIGWTALQHGHDLLLKGFTVSQVVHDYGDVCQAITELAVQTDAPISTDDFRVLNRCLDEAIAGAVTEYGRERNQSTLENETARGSERLGYFAHELRNLINTSIVAFEVLGPGTSASPGAPGPCCNAASSDFARSWAVRSPRFASRRPSKTSSTSPSPDSSTNWRPPPPWRRTRAASGCVVTPIDADVAIEADRQVLAAVVGNLLQNAYKFTQPRTTVTLRVSPARTGCSSRFTDGAWACRRGTWKSCSARSSSAAPIAPAWVLVSRSAGGALKRTTAGSRRATWRGRDASSPWTCHGSLWRRAAV